MHALRSSDGRGITLELSFVHFGAEPSPGKHFGGVAEEVLGDLTILRVAVVLNLLERELAWVQQ